MKGRVLTVNDEPDLLAAYGEMLREAGYAVEMAADGAKAMDLFAERGPASATSTCRS